MYTPIRGQPATPASRMQVLRSSYRALCAQPAFLRPAARASTKASAKADGDISQSELVDAVADKLQYEKEDVGIVIKEALQAITEAVADGHKVNLRGFGTFKRTETAARKGRNPQTGAELSLPASARPAFTAAKAFKDDVKAKYAGPSK